MASIGEHRDSHIRQHSQLSCHNCHKQCHSCHDINIVKDIQPEQQTASFARGLPNDVEVIFTYTCIAYNLKRSICMCMYISRLSADTSRISSHVAEKHVAHATLLNFGDRLGLGGYT
jgi:hypothetical protein